MTNAFFATLWDHVSDEESNIFLFSSGRLKRLSTLLNEKLEFLANLLVEKKNLEMEIKSLEDSLLYVISQYWQ